MRASIALVCAAAFVACSRPTPTRSSADVAGWYVRDISGGREVIDLRPNGDYVHVVAIRGAPTRADASHWHAAGDSVLVLGSYRDAAKVGDGAAGPDSVRASIRAAAPGELQLDVTGDSASFTRRLRYGKQRSG